MSFSSINQPPIIAIATPPGTGAIALLRISGKDSFSLLEKVFQCSQPFEDIPSRKVTFGRIIQKDGSVLDEVLLTKFTAPSSYTGEDMVEITCHGGVLVTAGIYGLLLRQGAQAADPGEFTLRAFLHGKMELTQAEAVMDLIHAKTPLALRAATEQLAGAIGKEIYIMREALLEVVAHLEAWIDFPEEDINPETGERLISRIQDIIIQIESLLSTANEGRILREGVRLAICGRPNAGKSSLLNRLLGYDRAIVSEIPGTTRDTIEEIANIQGIPFRIIDTAGLRHSEDSIEKQGIQRTKNAICEADIVLELIDATLGHPSEVATQGKPHLVVANKCDITSSLLPPLADALAISCHSGAGIPMLLEKLAHLAGHHQPEGHASVAAINARHQSCLDRARENLLIGVQGLKQNSEPPLIAIDLRSALDAIGEITGRIDAEEILGKIFSSFCIGK